MRPFQKIALVGPGAVGGYYGAVLARAGQNVHFLARSDYAALRERGMIVKVDGGEFRVHPIQAQMDPEKIGPCDLVLIAIKATANPVLPKILKPLVKPGTVLLTMQNGMGNVEWLAQNFPENPVVGCLCFVCINRTGPGVIENLMPGRLAIGPHTAAPKVAKTLVALFKEAGVKAALAPNLEEAIWRKLCWNVPFNGLAIAAGSITTDQIMASQELTLLSRLLMEEVRAASRARGIEIPDTFIQSQFDVTATMGPYKPSSLIDYRAGVDVEVEAIWGEPLRRGKSFGVPMPHLETLYLLLKRLVQARAGATRAPFPLG